LEGCLLTFTFQLHDDFATAEIYPEEEKIAEEENNLTTPTHEKFSFLSNMDHT
jgi:hypothetical protein